MNVLMKFSLRCKS